NLPVRLPDLSVERMGCLRSARSIAPQSAVAEHLGTDGRGAVGVRVVHGAPAGREPGATFRVRGTVPGAGAGLLGLARAVGAGVSAGLSGGVRGAVGRRLGGPAAGHHGTHRGADAGTDRYTGIAQRSPDRYAFGRVDGGRRLQRREILHRLHRARLPVRLSDVPALVEARAVRV